MFFIACDRTGFKVRLVPSIPELEHGVSAVLFGTAAAAAAAFWRVQALICTATRADGDMLERRQAIQQECRSEQSTCQHCSCRLLHGREELVMQAAAQLAP